MWLHSDIDNKDLLQKIRSQKILFGGNISLKIFGTLNCQSGKRMKKQNRIFFESEKEALNKGYRPCGNCMRENYKKWKKNMDLFNTEEQQNILPYDGEAIYYGKILTTKEADSYTDLLLNTIEWKNDEAVIFGKHILTARKVAWYAGDTFSYTYSGTTKQALLWTKELLELKKIAEELTGATYNSCLLNLYHNGNEGMAYHSDDEKTLGKNSSIASLSFGAERKFLFKHKTSKQTIPVFLENGSLLVMKGTTQTHWLHRLPPTTKVNKPRINLTFRTMVGQDKK